MIYSVGCWILVSVGGGRVCVIKDERVCSGEGEGGRD